MKPIDWSKGAAGLKFVKGCRWEECEVINVLPAWKDQFGQWYKVVYRYPYGATGYKYFPEDGTYDDDEPILCNKDDASNECGNIPN